MSSDDNDESDLKRLTVRELRQRAVKSLGSKMAAGLKLKDELVQALVKRTSKEVRPTKVAPKPAPKPVAAAKKSPPKAAAPAKKTPPKKSPPKKAAAPAAHEKRPSPPKATKPPKPSKAAVVAEAYELPISRDFFVDPRKPSLPASYGDDRLLCFRREPLAVVVSWDLSAATYGDGAGLQLEMITTQGKLVGSAPVDAPTGLATFDALPQGKPLSVQVVKSGRVMTRAQPFMLGAASGDDHGTWQMTAPIDQPLPADPKREQWSEAEQAAAVARAGAKRSGRTTSSRLSS